VCTDCVLLMADIWRCLQVTVELYYSRWHRASSGSVFSLNQLVSVLSRYELVPSLYVGVSVNFSHFTRLPGAQFLQVFRTYLKHF